MSLDGFVFLIYGERTSRISIFILSFLFKERFELLEIESSSFDWGVLLDAQVLIGCTSMVMLPACLHPFRLTGFFLRLYLCAALHLTSFNLKLQ